MKIYLVKTESKIKLSEFDTKPPKNDDDFKAQIKAETKKRTERLAELQELLWAEHKRKVLVIFQGLDTSGKDSTVRNVFNATSPQGVHVIPFKAPSSTEQEHDYLWRVHEKVPSRGEMAIFNRSHYEEVLVVRVQNLAPEKVWRRRYRHIVEWERMLADEGTLILKFFLHISKDEQKKRLQERLDQAHKNWKFDPSDLQSRGSWDQYAEAYEEVFEKSSTEHAPWYVVPADKKWYRDWVVSGAIVDAMEALEMQWPKPAPGLKDIKIE